MENSWIESYLEALLSQGLSTEHLLSSQQNGLFELVHAEQNVAAKYYVQQILDMDEIALWQVWKRVNGGYTFEEKDVRLAFIVWRVWFIKQKRQRVLSEEGARLKEEAVDETNLSSASSAPEDDDVDEEEDEATELTNEIESEVFTKRFSIRSCESDITENPTAESLETRVDKLYIILISLHGLIRGQAMELGRDADTGGQVKYVVELARELSNHPAVHRVDLLTRQICDPKVNEDYKRTEECLQKGSGKYGGTYIVLLPCGPSEIYIRKEELWPHIREFADHGLNHAKTMINLLAEAAEPCELFYIHGHYADAGEVAALMSQTLGVDMVLTGHSLGRNKLEHLLATGHQTLAEIEKTYNIGRRIEGEERALDEAIMVFTSTKQEILEQWGLYYGYNANIGRTLRRRKKIQYHIPIMLVVPPGLDFSHSKEAPYSNLHEIADWTNAQPVEKPEPHFWKEVFKFLSNPRKPAILALSRPDTKKNIVALVKAYAKNETLRDLANLVLVMGNRDIIDSLPKSSKSVLIDVLKLVDAYDLYGSVAYPKKHKQEQVSDIYTLAQRTRGVFVNVALQEPFGLTLIEAASYGVPIVATKNGGPVDIIDTLKNGLLVEPLSEDEISNALVRILTEKNLWEHFSKNGLSNIMSYSWTAHCEKCLIQLNREKRYIESMKQITPLRSSWDDSLLKEAITSTEPITESPSKSPKDYPSLDDHSMRFDPEARLAEEEKDFGKPRVALRTRLVIAALDNIPLAKQALSLLQSIVTTAYGFNSNRRQKSQVGFGVVSMLSFDATCKLLEQARLKVRDIDFIICNSGSDLFVWSGNDDMTSYEPFDVHIDKQWDKVSIERVLSRLWADTKRERKLLSLLTNSTNKGTGHFHILRVIEKQPVDKVDDVTVVDRVRAQLRRAGIRVGCVLQVDKTAAGAEASPLLHITPLRASRSLAIRFLIQRLGISMENIVMLCIASSIKSTPERSSKCSMTVGFVTSDADALIGGAQRVIIVPPTDETKVRVPKDKLDEQMIKKLQVECGPNIFNHRVVLLDGPKTKIDGEIAELLPVGYAVS